jgi:hypothetical protein
MRNAGWKGDGRRAVRRGVLAVAPVAGVVVGAFALAGASASAAGPTSLAFTQTATAGTARHGVLTLRGAGRNVVWFTNGSKNSAGHSSWAAMSRVVFAAGRPAPTATLVVAGRPGVAAMKLSRPRFNPKTRAVSYRVRRQGKRPLPARFGRAALTILPVLSGNTNASPPPEGSKPGPSFGGTLAAHTVCTTTMTNNTPYPLYFSGATKSDYNFWVPPFPLPDPRKQITSVAVGGSITWSTDATYGLSCDNSTSWEYHPGSPTEIPRVTMHTSLGWGGSVNADDCKVFGVGPAHPRFGCTKVSSVKKRDDAIGRQTLTVVWSVTQAP